MKLLNPNFAVVFLGTMHDPKRQTNQLEKHALDRNDLYVVPDLFASNFDCLRQLVSPLLYFLCSFVNVARKLVSTDPLFQRGDARKLPVQLTG